MIIKTNGSVVKVEPKNGSDFKLDELKEVVNGYIEIITLNDGNYMVVNEEGKINGLEYNPIATGILCGARGFGDFVVGNVLVCKTSEIK